MPTYGLQFSTIRTRVKEYASINDIVNADTKAGYAINDALRKLAAERRWLKLRRNGTITPVASTQSYSISGLTGFNCPVKVYYLSNGNKINIDIVDEDTWGQNSDSDTDGTPEVCIFSEMDGTEKLYLSPRPSDAFVSLYSVIYVDFDKKPVELSADSDIPEIPNTNNQMALVYYAVAELCAGQGDDKGVGIWEQKAMKELSKAFNNDINFKGKPKPAIPVYGIMSGINRNIGNQGYK